jgi:hypothetical protein
VQQPSRIPEDIEVMATEYKRLVPLMPALHMTIGKLAGTDAIGACAKRLQMMARQDGKKVINFTHELELDVFQDYLIYMHRPRGISFVQQMRNRKRYPQGSDEQRLLEGMVQARFSVFWIKEVVEEAGFIALDIMGGEECMILDQSIPPQDAVGLVSGFRIFPWANVWMHSGVNLPLGTIENADGLQPVGKLLNEKEERALNEDTIARWRAIINAGE